MLSPLIPGDGLCTVSMINTGYLGPTPLSAWIQTTSSEIIDVPVMSFLISKNGKHYLWDLGLPASQDAVNPNLLDAWKDEGNFPNVTSALPRSLPAEIQASLNGIFLSHYHWDHAGDISTVPSHVPIFLGTGSLHPLLKEEGRGFGIYVATMKSDCLQRLSELPLGKTIVDGLTSVGVDIFGDGSFVVAPGPGHCPGHSVAVIRVTAHPHSYLILGGDCGHNRSLYVECGCHGMTARLPPAAAALHYDQPTVLDTLSKLSHLQSRHDTWVILAHEREVIGVLPEREDMSEWKAKGWKDRVNLVMEERAKAHCAVGEQ